MSHQPEPRIAAVIATTSLPMAMAAIDDLALTFALPAIQRELGADIVQLSWVVNGYTLAFASLMLPLAALGDRFGRRRVFLFGSGLFAVASVAAALAGSIHALIAARIVQGAGAAAIVPLSLTLLSSAVPEARRPLAVGVWSGINGLGIAVGPLLGGVIVDGLHWSGIFWMNLPLGVVAIMAALRILPKSERAGTRFDLLGSLAAIGFVLPLSWALASGQEHTGGSAIVVGGLAAAAASLTVLVVRGMRDPSSLLPVRRFGDRAFVATNVAGLLASAGVFGAIFLLSQYLQVALGHTALQAGLLAAPWTLAPMVIAPLAGLAVQHIGARPVLILGALCQATALTWIDNVVAPQLDYPAILTPLALAGVGMGLTFAPLSAAVMRKRPEADRALAAAIHSCLRQLGMALGVAVATAAFLAGGAYLPGPAFVAGLQRALPICIALVVASAMASACLPGVTRPASPGPTPPTGR
ncbi:EmrB/QacA subfamily drug resistance transporter [Propionicimonas paludicola]|uniref:EmrB/QacA subfamily drug resistance transporter n=1 Tax=Propionicimonas paludicola TaxID=185243 RepID=A0A2A9CME3_9ACTN|nr:DHA2 family efflux MFS transporter permease subunit [Propionicimonas paludicola]PFG15574.1 EmrB/QacA subfamily drug resistance transporter [Propionicimonas paludicola]